MKLKLVLLSSLLLFAGACASVPRLTAPTPERIAELLEFSGPVSLTRHIATTNELANASKRKGILLASFAYDDPTNTSERIRISVYTAGQFMGERRHKLNDWIAKSPDPSEDGHLSFGTFFATDGRPIYQFFLGMGPGGSAYGSLMPCRDSRYELVIFQTTNGHDDEDPKEFMDHATPKKELRSVIETIESIVCP